MFKPFQSPQSFVFIDPDTGRTFRQKTQKRLVQEIISYRRQNRLAEIENLDMVLQNYWCSLPENVGKCKTVKLERGWMAYYSGGVALVRNFFYGEQNMCFPEEAERRAKICTEGNEGAVCPENIFPDKGPFVKYSDAIAEASTWGRSTSQDVKLGNCGACGCTLKAKVHFGGMLEFKAEELNRMPEYCWQKKLYFEQNKG